MPLFDLATFVCQNKKPGVQTDCPPFLKGLITLVQPTFQSHIMVWNQRHNIEHNDNGTKKWCDTSKYRIVKKKKRLLLPLRCALALYTFPSTLKYRKVVDLYASFLEVKGRHADTTWNHFETIKITDNFCYPKCGNFTTSTWQIVYWIGQC